MENFDLSRARYVLLFLGDEPSRRFSADNLAGVLGYFKSESDEWWRIWKALRPRVGECGLESLVMALNSILHVEACKPEDTDCVIGLLLERFRPYSEPNPEVVCAVLGSVSQCTDEDEKRLRPFLNIAKPLLENSKSDDFFEEIRPLLDYPVFRGFFAPIARKFFGNITIEDRIAHLFRLNQKTIDKAFRLQTLLSLCSISALLQFWSEAPILYDDHHRGDIAEAIERRRDEIGKIAFSDEAP